MLGRPPRVLLAEDDGEMRSGLVELFVQQGYKVSAVGTGSALLDVLSSSLLYDPEAAPDLLITDVWMPGVSVLNILEELRRTGWTTPIIVISGFADDEIRARVGGLGRAEFFDKPVEIGRLEEAMRSAMLRG
jgi:DNA-binding response OmpR family regulator